MEDKERTLIEYLDAVKDRATFLEYVEALARDREECVAREKAAPEAHRGHGAFGWQNDSIEDFLRAAACAETEHGNEELSWWALADFLYGGKVYE